MSRVVTLPPDFTLGNAGEWLARTPAAVARGEVDVLDFSQIERCDSAALALILAARRAAGSRPLELRALPGRLTQLARLYGVSELIGA